MESMLKRMLTLLMCLVAASSLAAAPARAQEPRDAEKAALVKELIELTNAGGNAEAIMLSVVNEAQKERSHVLEVALEELGGLTPAEREELVRKAKEDGARVNERVMRLFKEKIDLNRIVEEVGYAMYDKFYTAEELRDLVAFYKTPTGRKSITIMPQLFAESMAETGKRLLPQLEPIMKQIIQEERRRVEELLPPPKPKPRRPPGRRRSS